MRPSLLLAFVLALSTSQLQDEGFVKPSDYAPCGLNSFYLVCRLLDVPVDWDQARNLLGPSSEGGTHTFGEIANAAQAVGLHPVGLRADMVDLQYLPMPGIVQVRDPRRAHAPPHLLVLLKADTAGVTLLDPPGPAYSLPAERFREVWTGNVLLFGRTELESRHIRDRASRNSLRLVALLGASGACLLALALAITRVGRLLSMRQVRLACASLVGLVGLFAIVWFTTDGSPQCEIPSEEIQLGELKPGSFTTQIPIRNAGTSTLIISAVRSSCTCASTSVPEQLDANATGLIDVALDVGRGPQRAVLTIQSNDPAGVKRVTVGWHGTYRPVLHPFHVRSKSAAADKPFEKTLQVLYPGGEKAHRPYLERIEAGSSLITVREGENRLSAGSAENTTGLPVGELDLHLTITPPAPGAVIEEQCTLIVRQGQETYRLEFRVSVRFLGGRVAPESGNVVFTAATPQELVGQERLLRAIVEDYTGDLEITKFADWLTCNQERATDGTRVLRFRATQRPELAYTSHTLHLAIPGDADSKMPVVIHCIAPR